MTALERSLMRYNRTASKAESKAAVIPIAALYVRVSTDAQAETGYSIDEQQKRLIAYCTSQGIDNYNLYIDGGWSGSNLERPEMQRLIQDVKSHKISHVICYKLDRISRSQRDMLFLIEDVLIPNQVAFVSLSETIDTGTPMGRLMIGILSAFAQLERENIRERTQMGMLARVKSGLWPGGDRIPLGYDYDSSKGILVPNDYAKIIIKCFQLYLKGFSTQTIADMTGLKYGFWVRQILARKTYIGLIVFKGQEYQGQHLPIIEEDIFFRVQNRMEERSVKRLTTSKSLLSGMMKCGHCGATLYYQSWGKGKKKIGCYSRQKSKRYLVNDPNCPQPYYDPEEFEKAVIDDVFKFALEMKEQSKEPATNIDASKELEDTLNGLDAQLRRLYKLYAMDSNDMLLETIEDIKQNRKRIELKLLRLQDEDSQSSINQNIRKTIENLENIWPFLSIDEQRNILHIIIESIEVTDDQIDIHYRI